MWLIIIAWFVGRVASDRFVWSQWLLWIPTPVALAAAAIGVVISLRPAFESRRRTYRIALSLSALVAIAAYFGLMEHHFLRGHPESPTGLHLINLNASHDPDEDIATLIETIVKHHNDLTVLSSAHRVDWRRQLHDALGSKIRPNHVGTFVILTSLKIVRLEPIAFTKDDIQISLLEIESRASTKGRLRLYLVDLPSKPSRSRWAIAKKVRHLLDESDVPPPDLVLGDFNITRSSAAMQYMFPALRHAYENAGSGYGATFHRRFPLYHIDHVLLSDDWHATSYRLVDPGIGRHMLQSTHITPR